MRDDIRELRGDMQTIRSDMQEMKADHGKTRRMAAIVGSSDIFLKSQLVTCCSFKIARGAVQERASLKSSHFRMGRIPQKLL